MLKAIHAKEDLDASIQKIELVIEKLKVMKLPVAARTVEGGIREILSYTGFHSLDAGNSMSTLYRR